MTANPVVVTPDMFKALLTPEVWAVIVFFLSGILTGPLTTLLKERFQTTGATTERVNYAVSAFLTGLLPFLLGAYGFTLLGFAYAILVAFLRAITDQARVKQAAIDVAKGVKIAQQTPHTSPPPKPMTVEVVEFTHGHVPHRNPNIPQGE